MTTYYWTLGDLSLPTVMQCKHDHEHTLLSPDGAFACVCLTPVNSPGHTSCHVCKQMTHLYHLGPHLSLQINGRLVTAGCRRKGHAQKAAHASLAIGTVLPACRVQSFAWTSVQAALPGARIACAASCAGLSPPAPCSLQIDLILLEPEKPGLAATCLNQWVLCVELAHLPHVLAADQSIGRNVEAATFRSMLRADTGT